jgi:glycosyltransferase involved in cell wall biosynthesis
MHNKVIWVFNQFAGTPDSGFGERHFFFSRYWVREGYRVVIFSGSFNHMFRILPQTFGKFTSEIVDGVEFCWVKVPNYKAESVLRFWSMMVFAWRLLFIPRQRFGMPDVIIASSMPIFPIATAHAYKARKPSIQVLFEIRDIWPLTLQYLVGVSRWHPAVVFMSWFEKLGYRCSDKVVSLLPNARAHFEQVAGRKVNFVYIPNGLEEESLVDEPLGEEILSLLPQDKFLIGYTGTLAMANALESFLEAAIRLKEKKELHFVLVGDGYLKDKLVAMAALTDNVTFIPKIRKNQVQSIIRHFEVCFVGRHDSPLFAHGVSANKYFDYMLAGKPVLDANNYYKDPVELSGCGILVKPESVDALVEGIERFFTMTTEERAIMGAKGKKYVSINHSIRKLAYDYLAIF